MLKQAESPDLSPEELLRFCEVEIQRCRKKGQSARNRAIILTGALLLVVIGAFGALMVLFSMLRDMPRPEHGSGDISRGAAPSMCIHFIEPAGRHASC